MHNKELERLLAVDRFLKLKISKESELKEIAGFAAEICQTPIALITLIDFDTQHIKISYGTDLQETSRADAFCNYTIQQEDVMVISDTAKDPRFHDNRLRTGPSNVQFYAGAPLKTNDGLNLGSLCVIDHQPKTLTELQIKMLGILASQVIHILEFNYSLDILKNQYLKAKKNEITLRSLFESSQSCQLLVDTEFKILYFNKALADFMRLNHNQEIELNRPVSEFIAPKHLDHFMHNFKQALDGKNMMLELELDHGDQCIWWQFNYNPAYDSEGRIIGVSYNAIDISPLKKAQKQTMERNRALDHIALVQSHKIRRPVSSIIGISDLLNAHESTKELEEIVMLGRAVEELDHAIRQIVKEASNQIPVNDGDFPGS